MPSFSMLPNGTVLSEWTASAGGTAAYTDVDNDNGDTEYASSSTSNERMIFDLAAPSVAEEDIASIDAVQIRASAAKTLTGNSYVKFYMQGSVALGPDTITVSAGSYAVISGPVETSLDYSDLAGLQIRADKFRNDRFGELRISYLYAKVTYTEAITNNATFFGANF